MSGGGITNVTDPYKVLVISRGERDDSDRLRETGAGRGESHRRYTVVVSQRSEGKPVSVIMIRRWYTTWSRQSNWSVVSEFIDISGAPWCFSGYLTEDLAVNWLADRAINFLDVG